MATSSTPFPLGAYLNAPDSGDASNEAEFQTNYDSFTALMGTAPAYLDYFTDYTQPVSDWISNASWQAWSAVQAGSDATNATPVIALPMYSTAAGALTPDQQYQQIISGADDSVYTGIVDAWAADGFKNLVFRPGWEMNIPGNTFAGSTAQDQADWVAAFQHIYTVLHAAAAAAGITVTVVWNPATTSYASANATANLYPGNAYVDAIGADAYADATPYTNTPGGVYQDWATGGTDATEAQFIANPINMEHYWSYPAATVYSNDSSNGNSQSLGSLIQFAEQQGKPFAIPETGAGNSNSGNDVTDDPTYAEWLSSQLTTAQAAGLNIAFVNLWDSNAGGNYEFSNASDDKPQEAAAWAQYFGAQSGTTSASTSTATSTPTPTPSNTSTSANDTVVLSGSSAAITDTSGNSWTITGDGQVAVNGTPDTTTADVSELAYVNGTIWEENSSNVWWGETQPNASWGPSGGTSTSPLPAPITIGSGSTSTTVSQSQVSVAATAGTQMLFMSGSGDIVNLSGGADTVTETGSGNTYILPAAGNGSDTFTSNILTIGDMLDLRTALAATTWNGATSALSNYLTVADTAQGATLSIAPTSGGVGVAIATINGATGATLSSFLAQSIT